MRREYNHRDLYTILQSLVTSQSVETMCVLQHDHIAAASLLVIDHAPVPSMSPAVLAHSNFIFLLPLLPGG